MKEELNDIILTGDNSHRLNNICTRVFTIEDYTKYITFKIKYKGAAYNCRYDGSQVFKGGDLCLISGDADEEVFINDEGKKIKYWRLTITKLNKIEK